jgi:AraC-like DNA-binding protein
MLLGGLPAACIRALVYYFREWAMPRRSSLSVFPEPPPFVPPGRASALNMLHGVRLAEIDAARGPVFAYAGQYPDGYTVPAHRHTRAQLLEAAKGVVMVSTELGRWLVPPDHALWLPPGLAHSVEMLGAVTMHSVYVAEAAAETLPRQVRVVGLTALMQSLITEALASPRDVAPDARARLINALILTEIARLPPRPLGLPMPREPRLADGEPVTSVALDLGYDSAAAFTTMFTRMLGAPPRAYFGKGG